MISNDSKGQAVTAYMDKIHHVIHVIHVIALPLLIPWFGCNSYLSEDTDESRQA